MPDLRASSSVTDATLAATSTVEPAILEELDPDAATDVGLSLWAVVFAGGIGTRFWPLSTPERPKQVLPLVDERPLIADTVARLAPLVPADRVLVLTSADIADALHAAIPEVPRTNLLVEPRPLGTAAALAWGAHEVARRAGPRTVFCAMHADLAVGYPDVFRDTLRRAARLAGEDPCLVALGATPTRSETGFGYLHPDGPVDPFVPLAEGGACRVAHVVEKPNAALADTLVAEGALWNTGIYVWQAQVVLEQLTTYTPELRRALPALARGDLEGFAGLVTSVSIERGLLERSEHVVVLPTDFDWDDVGTWASLRRVRELDDRGNGVIGLAHCVDASGNVVHAADGCVVVYGVSGMLVVAIDGLTFVTSLERATELGPLLNALPGSLRFAPGRRERERT
jgi:mannose-1-phosphate guanylyltransferase